VGHYISAAILHGKFDQESAAAFSLHPIQLSEELTLFPLHDSYVDAVAEKLAIQEQFLDGPLLNTGTVHHLMNAIAVEPLFAIIETNYCGGIGSQSAVVYRGKLEIMAPERDVEGSINRALKQLGVKRSLRNDEFDTIGLGNFRDFDDIFYPCPQG
jgi:hypothetical protein